MSTDRIEKDTVLRAPREKVWRALTDATQFGEWFGCKLDGPFVAGQNVTGHIVPTTVDPDVAKLQEPHRGFPIAWQIDRIEPMTLFSFRWHPFAIDPKVDYSGEPMTLVTFELADAAEGTSLRITETGFEKIPLERRARAFAANDGGWAHQAELLGKYLTQ
ncbi:MAG TPA: SRPBCC family protein [Kofleriaceae bacterium]|jgi:uncharacterized protein YndB with AHSA1/START domain